MIDIKTEVVIEREVFYAELGIIERTMLGMEDHGIFTFLLTLNFGGVVQGAGTFGLDNYDKDQGKRVATALGMDMIMEILRVAGVREWENLKGVHLMALRNDRRGYIRGILNPHTEEYLIFEDHYKKWGVS